MYRSFLLSVVVLTLGASITLANPWVARHGLSGAEYQAEFNKWTGQGYRLEQVSGYGVGNQVFYAAIWEKKTAWSSRSPNSPASSGQSRASIASITS